MKIIPDFKKILFIILNCFVQNDLVYENGDEEKYTTAMTSKYFFNSNNNKNSSVYNFQLF